MVDYELILKKIQTSNRFKFTTKELLQQGLNDYYIRKLVDLEKLKRVERGVYEVVKTSSEKTSNHFFQRFAASVFQQDYQKAYDLLQFYYQSKTTHQYDNHLRLYFILLEHILDLNYDSEHFENIYDFSERKTDTYYQDYILFQECVLSHDFANALTYMSSISQNEILRNGHKHIST